MKYTIQILTIAFLFAFSSCTKDDVKSPCTDCTISGKVVYLPIGCVGNSNTLGLQDLQGNYYYVNNDLTGHFNKYKDGEEVCFDFKVLKDCELDLTSGIMEIPVSCIDLTCLGKCTVMEEECYTVVYLPTQCADNEFSKTLGFMDSKGVKYLVSEDKSGMFKKLKDGDMVKIKFDKVKECMVCYACTCPKPDFCAIVYSITKCSEEVGCTKAQLFADYKPAIDKQEHHGITVVGYANEELNLKIGISGCDGEIKPDLILRRSQLKSYPQIYDAYLSFNRKPQLCQAYFQVSQCFSLKELMLKEKKVRLLFHDSSGKTKELIVE